MIIKAHKFSTASVTVRRCRRKKSNVLLVYIAIAEERVYVCVCARDRIVLMFSWLHKYLMTVPKKPTTRGPFLCCFYIVCFLFSFFLLSLHFVHFDVFLLTSFALVLSLPLFFFYFILILFLFFCWRSWPKSVFIVEHWHFFLYIYLYMPISITFSLSIFLIASMAKTMRISKCFLHFARCRSFITIWRTRWHKTCSRASHRYCPRWRRRQR